jgi:hypothetical protein
MVVFSKALEISAEESSLEKKSFLTSHVFLCIISPKVIGTSALLKNVPSGQKIIGTRHLIFVGGMRKKKWCNNINHRTSAAKFLPPERVLGRKASRRCKFWHQSPGALCRA